MSDGMPYLTGTGDAPGLTLSRYLPPLQSGVAAAWLAENIPPGSWVLDPFGASPLIALEAARAGYRVLVAANNPVVAFLIEMLAGGYSPDEYRAALAELASARKGDERLEPHIQSLYQTVCRNCGRTIVAEAFLWQDIQTPYACIYRCPFCGDEGERMVGEESLAILTRIAHSDGLPRSRALERVAPLEDPSRPDVEEALNCYLPRPLYALFTLINKLEGLPTTPLRRKLLSALLISVCDEANTLWQHPTVRSRPKQLTVPPHFRENNLWLALEAAIPAWVTGETAVPFVRWPEQPPASGGISLHNGRLRDIVPDLKAIPFRAVLTALPRPNQAFWTLSALWAGWLWGKDAVQPLKSALTRRRYDWNWHAVALHAAFSNLSAGMSSGTPVFAGITEAEPAFIAAALIAAACARLALDGIAFRQGQDGAQVLWRLGRYRPSEAGMPPELPMREAASAYLSQRGEPCSFSQIACAALSALAGQAMLAPATQISPGDALTQIQSSLRRVLSDRNIFLRYGGSDHSLEVGLWWLRGEEAAELSLSDRVEMAVERYLQEHPGCTLTDLDQAVCHTITGLYTPDRELVQTCLESYGEPLPDRASGWRLREEDTPSRRVADLQEMSGLLSMLGERLGYAVSGEMPLVWKSADGVTDYTFYPIASAVAGRYLLSEPSLSRKACLVLPGGRANLLTYKLQRDPRLKRAAQTGWHFIKFRHLRRIADIPVLTRETWSEQIEFDPPETKATQMDMF